MELYVGTSGYSYPKWKGTFYPPKLPAKRMLAHYGEQFRSVEINSTFMRVPAASTVAGWASAVPAGFRFVLKAPQLITHKKRLKDVGEAVALFHAAAAPLSDLLGPLLFQLPPNLKKDAPRLADFLASLPVAGRTAIEFRHASWLDDEVFGLLRDHNAALCLADAGDELQVPFVATADWGYLRLRRPDYDEAALDRWRNLVVQQHWRDAYVFFKHEDEGRGPALARRFLDESLKPESTIPSTEGPCP